MALTTAEQAALTAALQRTRGRFKLRKLVVDKLVALFVALERPAAELPVDVPEAEAASLKDEWIDFCSDAGLTMDSDVNGVVRWALASVNTDVSTTGARSIAVLSLLADRGIDLPSNVKGELDATLRAVGEAGDVVSQCKSAVCVCILYTVESPGEEMVKWVETRAKSLSGAVGKVDLRSFDGYIKLHKNTSKTTLERALLDRDLSNTKLNKVKEEVTDSLYTAGLPLAATQWQRVTGWAAAHFRHDPAKEKVYLWGYFFCSFLGLGMPTLRDHDTLVDMQAPTPGSALSKVEAEMRPTVPAEATAYAYGGVPPGLGPGSASALGGGQALGLEGLAGLPPQLGAVLAAQQSQMAALTQALEGLGARGGGAPEEPPIRELPAPKVPVVKCDFCHSEHEATFKCAAKKQSLRLKADWDKEQAKARKEAEAAAKTPA